MSLVNAQVKALFFDRAIVIGAVDKGTRAVLSKFGAFVMTRARTSMRYRKGPSVPGTPPNAHTGLIRKGVVFNYEPVMRNVVIGPTELDWGEKMAQELNEKGGAITRVQRHGPRSIFSRKRVYIYPKRAYMVPAFDEEKKNLPVLWANSIK